MSLYNYTFMGEVKEEFDIQDYTPLLGDIGNTVADFTIYTLPGSTFFYLHQEATNKLFQFYAIDPRKLNSREEYENVIKAYFLVDFL